MSKTTGAVATQYLVDDLRRYTHGQLRVSETQILNGSWTTSYYGYDDGGSMRKLTDATDAIINTHREDRELVTRRGAAQRRCTPGGARLKATSARRGGR